MTDLEILYKRGILRKCGDCDFQCTTRQEMRAHERQTKNAGFPHYQTKRGVDEARKYTPEEQAARRKAKYGNAI